MVSGIKCVSGEILGFYGGNCRGISTSQQEAGKIMSQLLWLEKTIAVIFFSFSTKYAGKEPNLL